MEDSYRELLRAHNLSVTAVRLAVLDALYRHPHSDAEQILNIVKNKIDATSKQAIYNNLNTLVEHGLVREIKPKGQASLYETRVDDNHHHLVCRHCQKVVDTDCAASAPCLEPDNRHGFIVDEAEVVFWGTCPDCQSSATSRGGKSHE